MRLASLVQSPAQKPAAPAQPVDTARRGATTALALSGGLILMTLMGMTVADVIGRYLFNSPIKGAAELTELLLAAVVFMGLPAVAMTDAHVTVDLVTDKMPAWIQPWRRVAVGLVSAGILVVVGWRIWVYADQIGSYGGSTSSLRLPIAPLGYFCALCTYFGAVLTALVPVWALVSKER